MDHAKKHYEGFPTLRCSVYDLMEPDLPSKNITGNGWYAICPNENCPDRKSVRDISAVYDFVPVTRIAEAVTKQKTS